MQENLINLIGKRKKVRMGDIISALGISRPTALKYLKLLEAKGIVTRVENGPQTFYTPTALAPRMAGELVSFSKTYQRKDLREYDVFQEVSVRFLKSLKLSENMEHVLSYAFTEMLNNAIDHSQSLRITIEAGIAKDDIYFIIRDFGVGIFENLKTRLSLATELEGAQEMTKGKVTTDPEHHTGQGVFFTSRVADAFTIKSHLLEYSVEYAKDNFVIVHTKKNLRGTEVFFRIKRNASIHLTDIFRKFEDDDWSFSKTEIIVKLYSKYAHLVSRSQAKMILSELDKFSKITFDFKDVEQIGQGFADEIFRVFQVAHPSIALEYVNANENVVFMIKRAREQK